MDVKRTKLAICEFCGRPFMAFKQSKGRFCSRKCTNEIRQVGIKEHGSEILKLYSSGLGCDRISQQVGVSRVAIRKFVERSGIFEPGRVSPATLKGHRFSQHLKLSDEDHNRRKLLRDHHRSEMRAHRIGDDQTHWRKHPELLRWLRQRNFQNQKAAKSNYHISKILRSRIYNVLKGLKKSAPAIRLLGCSMPTFRRYLEARFRRGMRWENYGTHWHIDHKEPCASFDLSKPDQQRRCFHYSNLQPMLAAENWKKHATVTPTQRELLLAI